MRTPIARVSNMCVHVLIAMIVAYIMIIIMFIHEHTLTRAHKLATTLRQYVAVQDNIVYYGEAE